MNSRFWAMADQLVSSSRIVIDRPRGTLHPRFEQFRYELDYGYLEGTTAMDGGGVDLWRGTLPEVRVTGAIMTIDGQKKDAEVKLLVSCTPAEAAIAERTHNQVSQAGLLVLRGGD